MNETVTGVLVAVGGIACVVWLIRAFKTMTAKSLSQAETAAAAPLRPGAADADAENDAAVIAAAVYALLGATRVVHIEDAGAGRRWAAEGRWMHQTSHRLR